MEIIHFVGLSLLLGGFIVIDLRLMGFFRQVNLAATHKLLPLVFFGFTLNLITGTLFFFGDPMRYAINIGFQAKMILVAIAGLNALWYYWKIRPILDTLDADADPPPLAKTIAFLSLGCWTSVLLLGRLIPYVGTG
ncbi:MAG: hypothetical protein MI725_12485 [Pirellulales bacterium]|nr:hypothetical protein [Pirellulales bacterium]